MENEYNLKAVSLFTGAGGLCGGFLKAGFDVVWANEIDKTACKTYENNHPDVPLNCVDIHDIASSDIRNEIGDAEIDVVIGGPPCQGFSNAGNRNSTDPRNELVFDFVRIVEGIKPKFFLMDNVDWLEAASSILIFIDLYGTTNKSVIVERVRNKNNAFNERREFIEGVWEDLCVWGLINVQ